MRLAAAPEFDLLTIAPRLAARFAVRRRFWAAALVELPVAGSDGIEPDRRHPHRFHPQLAAGGVANLNGKPEQGEMDTPRSA